MKALAVVTFTLSLCGAISADEPVPKEPNASSTNAPIAKTESFHSKKLSKGSELIGIEVFNPEKERLGSIKDLMLNLHQERVIYTVLGTGGFLGIGDKLVPLPPSALEVPPGNKHLILQSDKESLKAAPGIESNNWPEMANVEWYVEAERHYAGRTGASVNEAAGAEKKTKTVQEPPISTNQAKRIQTSPAQPQNVLRTTDLIGMSIRDLKGERIGDVKDVALDLQSGKILYVVVAESGFSGDEKLFAIAPVNFQKAEQPKTLVLDTSHANFTNATSFGPNNWPIAADNAISTKKQIQEPSGSPRPGEGDGRTALDQSNTRRDLMITQQLRRAIMRDDTMSILTRNITIITADGRITVRGTVASQDEVEKIVSFAREIAGNEVTNELTVQNEQERTNETAEPKKE